MKGRKTVFAIGSVIVLAAAAGSAAAASGLAEEKTVSEVTKRFTEKVKPLEKKELSLPELPAAGKEPADFVPDGWELMDSVEMDFNRDGITDYIGVLDPIQGGGEMGWPPRILFAIAGEGPERYRLDFQDENLIRTRGEGGVYGDPYQNLTAEGSSFTTHTYGGSAWRWWEDYTYTYKEGIWYLTSSEEGYGYGWYTTDYSEDDWESGTGIRKKRSSEFGDMEQHWDEEDPDYDLAYEVTLDEPLTLQQAGRRWWLAVDRVRDWEVKGVKFADGIEPWDDFAEFPEKNTWFDDCDEECALYTFHHDDKDYIAMYQWQDKTLFVMAETEAEMKMDSLQRYGDKIYYVTEVQENIRYKTMEDGVEHIEEERDTVGVRLNRVDMDGTGMETIFEYRYPEAGQDIKEKRPPYLSLIFEITGGEIVAEVYNGDGVHPFYRMNTDGSGQYMIGQTPAR